VKQLKIIYDLDSTLADCEARVHKYIICAEAGYPHKRAEIDWPAFFSECEDDLPIKHVIDGMEYFMKQGHDVRIWTGRSDIVRRETERWLQHHIPMFIATEETLIMRGAEDRTDDDILKIQWLNEHSGRGWRPDLVFEDRDRIVKAYRERGVNCIQVAPGDF
jgi:hypothetical protein